MFSFNEQEQAPAKPAANKKKSSRRVSLADRSRNDENAMPPSTPGRALRGPAAGKGASLQAHQAFMQVRGKGCLGAGPGEVPGAAKGSWVLKQAGAAGLRA